MPEAKLKVEARLKGMCWCNKPAALVPSSAGPVRAVANRANLVAAVMNFGSVHSLLHLQSSEHFNSAPFVRSNIQLLWLNGCAAVKCCYKDIMYLLKEQKRLSFLWVKKSDEPTANVFLLCSCLIKVKCSSASGSWWRSTKSGFPTPRTPASTSDPPSSELRWALASINQHKCGYCPACWLTLVLSFLTPPPAVPRRVSGRESYDLCHHRPSRTVLCHRILQPRFPAGGPFVCQGLARRSRLL